MTSQEPSNETIKVHADSFRVSDSDGRGILQVAQFGMKDVALPPPRLGARLVAWWKGEVLPTTESVPDLRLQIRSDLFADGTISPERFDTVTPTEPGFYWARRKNDDNALTIVEVVASSNGDLSVMFMGNLTWADLDEASEWVEFVSRIPEPA